MLDLLIINPCSKSLYQGLASKFSAIEPNIWAGMLAESTRKVGYSVQILDLEAEPEYISNLPACVKYLNPRLLLFVATGQNPNASSASMDGVISSAEILKLHYPEFKIAVVGPHASALPTEILEKHQCIDIVFTNEGVYALRNVLASSLSVQDLSKIKGIAYRDNDRVILNVAETIVPQNKLLTDLPGMAIDLFPDSKKYRTSTWHTNYNDDLVSPFYSIYTSLGCPFTCLSGDTNINTIYGLIPIKELAEKYQDIGIYTYDINTKQVIISKGINICKTGINKKLIRVHFDDGSHIDCTPDHKFLTWDQGNQFQDTIEYEIEARNLKPKQSVRAIKVRKNSFGYIVVEWGRRKHKFQHKLVLEYKLGRELIKPEQTHHIDKNRSNNHPDNLLLISNSKEHSKLHPEVSLRMKVDNPVKYCTKESRAKIGLANRDKTRSIEQKIKYSESKKGMKNPNYKHGLSCGQQSRVEKEINHKILYIEELSGEHDVYCMHVPKYNWFFANNVLVHNCKFCMINIQNRTNNDLQLTADSFNIFRYWEPSHIIKWFDKFAEMGVKNIKIADELFVYKPAHCLALCDLLIERKYNFNIWAYTRVNTVKEQYLEKFKKAGINWLAIGVEAANQSIRTEITKGLFKDENIRDIISKIRSSGINVIANYIFGLGHDTYQTMQENLDFAIELNTEEANMYAAVALPGSPLYFEAKKQGWQLPQKYSEYGFLSYDAICNRTETLTAAEVLKFRDEAWYKYHTNEKFLKLLENKFGLRAKESMEYLTKIKIKRKLYD